MDLANPAAAVAATTCAVRSGLVQTSLPETPTPFVSVIIPVYADEGNFRYCLAGLAAQNYPEDKFEVIVVDNGGNAGLDELTRTVAQARLVSEPRAGSYVARNAGIAVAQGEVFAFIDADCVPAVDWLNAGTQRLQAEPDCGLVGGKLEMLFAMPGRPTVLELYDRVINFDQRTYIELDRYSVTANLFTTVTVLQVVGGFDENLRSCGDKDWGNRVDTAGFRLCYAEEVVVRHAARNSFKATVGKLRRVSGGNVGLRRKQGNLRGAFAIGRFILSGLVPPLQQWREAFAKVEPGQRHLLPSLLLLIAFFKYVRTFEALRVLIGGDAKR